MKSLISTLGLSLLMLLPQSQPAAAKKCPAYWLETAQGPLKALDNEAPKERNLNPGRKRCSTFVVRHRVVERPTGGYPNEFPCPEPDACEFSRQQVSVRPLKPGVQITSITADEGTRLREAGEEGYVWTVPASTLEAEGEEVYQLRVCIKGRLGQEDWADLLEPNLDAAISATQPCPWSMVA